jgi:PKD repeat protein
MLRISILLLSMSAMTVFGQITINKNHMPSSGDEIEYSTARPLNVDVSKTGDSVEWDYTKLVNLDDGIDAYISSLRTPYILSFGFTTFGKKLMDTLGFGDFQFKNIYNFYQNSNASFRDVGMGFQFAAIPLPQAGKHTDADEIFVFPLEYGDKDSTTFDVEVPISVGIKLGSFFRSGNRVTTVDGWGKISTPYAKDVECIRVKSVITELDSIKVSTPAINFGQVITRIEYKWLSTTEKMPLLTITGNEVLGSFAATSVVYRNEWSKVSPITVDFESDKVSPKQGDVVSFTNKSVGDNLTYEWSLTPSMGFIFVNGTNETNENPVLVFQDTGWYSVTLTATDKNGSKAETKNNYVHVRDRNSGINDIAINQFDIFPNPTLSHVTISPMNSIDPFTVSVYDVAGVLIKTVDATGNTDVTLPKDSGVYVLHISSIKAMQTKRILKL